MTDRSQWTLYLVGACLLLLLCLIVGLWWYKRRMDKIHAHIGGVPQGDVAALHKVVADQNEMTRQHVSNTVGSIQHDTEMTKGHVIDVKSLLGKLMHRITGGPRT